MKKILPCLAMVMFSTNSFCSPMLSKERVVFYTSAGDFALALYPQSAPKHVEQILRLVGEGAYDLNNFARIEPGFVVQISSMEERLIPLSQSQATRVHRLNLEIDPSLKHKRGVVSMGHLDDDPGSATTSFAILLSDSPHLDGKYTIVGEVESGMDVVDRISMLPRDSRNRPKIRIDVLKAEVVPGEAHLRRLKLRGPIREIQAPTLNVVPTIFIYAFALILTLNVALFLSIRVLSKKAQLAIQMASALTAGFALFIALTKIGQKISWVSILLFAGVVALIKWMSRFESMPRS